MGKIEVENKSILETAPYPGTAEPKNVSIDIPASAENKEPPKEKKTKASRKLASMKDADPILKAQVATMTSAIFFGVSSVTREEHWKLSEEEILNIADPAARILERLGAADVTGKYGDYIMLVTALGMAVIPRYILISQLKKERNLVNVRPFPQPTSQPDTGQSKRETKGGSGNDSKKPADNSFSVRDDAIPAILDPA